MSSGAKLQEALMPPTPPPEAVDQQANYMLPPIRLVDADIVDPSMDLEHCRSETFHVERYHGIFEENVVKTTSSLEISNARSHDNISDESLATWSSPVLSSRCRLHGSSVGIIDLGSDSESESGEVSAYNTPLKSEPLKEENNTAHHELPKPYVALRRPQAGGVWWNLAEDVWEASSTSFRRTWTHVGMIMETEYGARATMPCTRCQENRYECWVYTTAARETFRVVSGKCAFCLAHGKICSILSPKEESDGSEEDSVSSQSTLTSRSATISPTTTRASSSVSGSLSTNYSTPLTRSRSALLSQAVASDDSATYGTRPSQMAQSGPPGSAITTSDEYSRAPWTNMTSYAADNYAEAFGTLPIAEPSSPAQSSARLRPRPSAPKSSPPAATRKNSSRAVMFDNAAVHNIIDAQSDHVRDRPDAIGASPLSARRRITRKVVKKGKRNNSKGAKGKANEQRPQPRTPLAQITPRSNPRLHRFSFSP